LHDVCAGKRESRLGEGRLAASLHREAQLDLASSHMCDGHWEVALEALAKLSQARD
jgi:hypothetical protein